METRKSKNFLLNHVSMYELISMENSKYLVWKLMFPRCGDTFYTIDKTLDMCSWEKLYSILKRITLQYAASKQLPSQSISVSCCEFWYRLTIEKIPMDIKHVHEFCDINVETHLLHDEILCVKLYNCDEFADNSSITDLNIAETSMSRKRSYSVTSLGRKDERERQISRPSTPTSPSRPSVSPPKRPSVTTQTATSSTPKRKELFKISSTSGGDATPTAPTASFTENHDDNFFLRYSDDDDCENESDELSSHSSDSTLSSNQSNESENSDTKTVKRQKIRMDLSQLSDALKDPKYLNAFCFESDVIGNCQNRTFNVYTVDDKISYAAFHSPLMVKSIGDRSNCKLFFCYSAELLRRFQNFSEMQFEGIDHILMVYINHISDRVRPFGYIFLPNKSSAILLNVTKVIETWLNHAGTVSTVTKCVTPHDDGLHQGIAATWPQAKLIGCSAEFIKDIKLFATRNKGVKAPNAELTRLACVLCFLPEISISEGIEAIEKSNPSEYAIKLAQYLRTKWIGRPISIYDENVVYRSLKVCNLYNNQMLRNRFRDVTNPEGQALKDCWDFVQFLKTESGLNSIKMGLDGTKYGSQWRKSFALNTKKQKERESHIVNITNEFKSNLNTMSQGDAIKNFLQQMVLYV